MNAVNIRRGVLATILLFALVLVACSGKSDKEPDSTSAPEPTSVSDQVPTTVVSPTSTKTSRSTPAPRPSPSPRPTSTPVPDPVFRISVDTGVAAKTASDVFVGLSNSCLLSEDGDLFCWGRNPYGNVGDESTTDRNVPVRARVVDDEVADVAIGGSFTCVLSEQGGVKCWGANRFGYLGDGTQIESPLPVGVTRLSRGVVDIEASGAHACALMDTGAIHCWGFNNRGQLGDGKSSGNDRSEEFSSVPTTVVPLDSPATQISLGSSSGCALLEDGYVMCWGWNEYGQLGTGTTIAAVTSPERASELGSDNVAVSMGSVHTCVLKTDGNVDCVGHNRAGQVGTFTEEEYSTYANRVKGLGEPARAISSGNSHTCALMQSGGLKCWGRNAVGALGDGAGESTREQATRWNPSTVIGLGSDVLTVDAGGENTCAIVVGGTLKCWGTNRNGEVGDSTTETRYSPVSVHGFGASQSNIGVEVERQRFAAVAGGSATFTVKVTNAGPDATKNLALVVSLPNADTSVVVDSIAADCTVLDKRVICAIKDLDAGFAREFLLRVETPEHAEIPIGASVHSLHADLVPSNNEVSLSLFGVTDNSGIKFASIASGGRHTCALDSTGTTYCWGESRNGQLGQEEDRFLGTNSFPLRVENSPGKLSSLSAGATHSCAITGGGGVVCWGSNQQGQIGNGFTGQYQRTPVVANGLESDAALVAAGDLHTCAVMRNSDVYCWGANSRGQIGDGTQTGRTNPVQIDGIPGDIVSISASNHTCAAFDNGEVYCWGANGSGQAGPDTIGADQQTPSRVVGVSDVASVSAGREHTCALSSAGTVSCWGAVTVLGDETMTPTQTPITVTGFDSAVVALSAGDTHTCAVTESGAASCWGLNEFGELGSSSTGTESSRNPVLVDIVGDKVKAISAGQNFTCAVLSDSNVKCWGSNQHARLGSFWPVEPGEALDVPVADIALDVVDSNEAISPNQKLTRVLTLTNFGTGDSGPVDVRIKLPIGAETSSTTAADGTCETFLQAHVCRFTNIKAAASESIQVTTSYSMPDTYVLSARTDSARTDPVAENNSVSTSIRVVTDTSAAAISLSTSWQNSCVVDISGRVMCWGANDYGQLGSGVSGIRRNPVRAVDLNQVPISVVSGSRHACALLVSRDVYCWGATSSGVIGDGRVPDFNFVGPQKVTRLPGPVIQIAAGSNHTCALIEGGDVRCWGANNARQIGDGATTARRSPVPAQIGDVVQISAGGQSTCVVLGDGSVGCWGSNRSGQVGDGTTTDQPGPIGLRGQPDAAMSVSVGQSHACVLLVSGKVYCWGDNRSGQLGNGTTENSLLPVEVVGLDGQVTAISAGWVQTCALMSTGEVKCWGDAEFSNVGDRSTSIEPFPFQVSGLSNISDVSVGLTHACAIDERGQVLCWGDNRGGQLGDGTAIDHLTPMPVNGFGGSDARLVVPNSIIPYPVPTPAASRERPAGSVVVGPANGLCGAGSVDTYISKITSLGDPDTSPDRQDTLYTLFFGHPSAATYMLLNIDVSCLAGKSLRGDAFLDMYVAGRDFGFEADRLLAVYEVLVPWSVDSVTLDNFGNSPGLQIESDVGPQLDVITVSYPAPGDRHVRLQIPAELVQRWIDRPSTNRGLLVTNMDRQGNRNLEFSSFEGDHPPELLLVLTDK